MSKIISVYSDAGIIGTSSTSKIGGTWAFCHVDENDNLVSLECGIILCDQLGVKLMTSPLAETYAAVRALWPMPNGWDGTFYCDNETAIGRIFWDWACNGVPKHLEKQARGLGKRLNVLQPILLGGHPTKKELENGRRKDGKPVSKWNVLCDKKCKQLSKGYFGVDSGESGFDE